MRTQPIAQFAGIRANKATQRFMTRLRSAVPGLVGCADRVSAPENAATRRNRRAPNLFVAEAQAQGPDQQAERAAADEMLP